MFECLRAFIRFPEELFSFPDDSTIEESCKVAELQCKSYCERNGLSLEATKTWQESRKVAFHHNIVEKEPEIANCKRLSDARVLQARTLPEYCYLKVLFQRALTDLERRDFLQPKPPVSGDEDSDKAELALPKTPSPPLKTIAKQLQMPHFTGIDLQEDGRVITVLNDDGSTWTYRWVPDREAYWNTQFL